VHSSTKAEFSAACDAGKSILFFGSLLSELNTEQQHATILYEDNNGALIMAMPNNPQSAPDIWTLRNFHHWTG
jgi:hypothetical protein